MKRSLIILVCTYSCIYAQFTIPMKQPKFFSLGANVRYHDDKVDFILQFGGKFYFDPEKIVQKLTLDLKSNSYELKDVFGPELYKQNDDKRFEGVQLLDEYAINSMTTNFSGKVNQRTVIVYNLKTDESFQFDIEVGKGLMMTLFKVIKNINEDHNELIFFSKVSNEGYVSFSAKTNTYTITRVDLDTKQVTTSLFEPLEDGFSIYGILSVDDPRHCLVKLTNEKDEATFSLFNFDTQGLTKVNIPSSQKYIHEIYTLKVKGGIILTLLTGDKENKLEVIQLGISYEDETVTVLTHEPYDPDNGSNYSFADEYSRGFVLDNELYKCDFSNKKLVIAHVHLDGISRKEYAIEESLNNTQLISANNEEVEFYSDDSPYKGKKIKIKAQLLGDGIEITEMDKDYTSFEATQYIKNGNTYFMYYKWDKTGLMIDQEKPE